MQKRIDIKEILGEKVIDELRHIFHESTGMTITFSPLGKSRRIDFYPEEERSPFCKLVHASRTGRRRCLACDRTAIKKAFRIKAPYIYTCHAGLIDFVVPLILNGSLVGSLLSGQLLTKKTMLADFKSVWEKTKDLHIDKNSLKRAYNKVKVFSRRDLDMAVKLFSLIANYIVEKETSVILQKELINHQKRLLAEAQKREKLRQELKKAMPFLRLETMSEKDQTRGQRIAREAKHFIESHYAEPITLDIVSESVFLSPSYFSSFFKKYSRYTFNEYLTKVRVEKAKELLERLDLNITRIAQEVGYEDFNYFSQIFKKVTGITPSEYRKKVIPA